jgi:hypothetical protein
MTTKLDARQIISRDLLDQVATAAGVELDNLLRSLNNNDTPPLKLSCTGANRVVSVGSIFVQNPETLKYRTIPTVSNALPNFTSGTITAGATGAGTIVYSPSIAAPLSIGMTASQYRKFGINMDAVGNLTLTAGTAAASLAAATAPPGISNTFGVGYFVLRTDGANNVQNVLLSDLYQFVGGGGAGGGSGDANSFLETIKANLREGAWALATPNIFSVNEDDLIDGSSTGAYSLVTQNYEYTAGAQFLLSTQMLDSSEFLGEGRDVKSVQLMAKWATGAIDTAATYQVSRDGGNEFQTVTMDRVGTTDTYVGTHVFTTEAADQSLVTQASTTGVATLNVSAQQKIAQLFTLADASVVRKLDLYVTKGGSPVGNIYISIVKDSAGSPSTALADLVSDSSAVLISGLSNGLNTITLPDTVLIAGSYHVVVRTDQTYKDQFTASAGVDKLDLQTDGTANGLTVFNGTSWSDPGTSALKYTVKGRKLDLRVKITASAGSKQLEGYGILYDLQTNGIVGGIKNRQVFRFNSTSNPNSFALTQFRPDPDLLSVYLVETGQVFKAPSFYLSGNTIVFPANSFNNGGTPADLTLVFDQTTGTSFDNSDANALLLAGNFLGSTDATIDRSQSGRGIFLRRPDGTLRELTIDNSDNIAIYSV